MIEYRGGLVGLGIRDLFRVSGSVVPKALFWAIPSAGIAAGLWYYWEGKDSRSSGPVSRVFNGYSSILGFMIIFRLSQAYNRFWEAATLTNELRSEWLDAAQTTISFCSPAKEKADEVEKFQHLLVRLLSMLHRAALERLNMNEDEEFPVIDTSAIGQLDFLGEQSDRCEIIYSWIMKLIINKNKEGVISIPPPILGRSFKEVGGGMAKLHNVMKITTIPIPFPYVQMSSFLLLFHWFITPIIAALIQKNARWAATLAFMSVFCLWAIYYMAAEIEQPFGRHKNNLPCMDMQTELNRMLIMVLSHEAQEPPDFDITMQQKTGSEFTDKVSVVRQKTGHKSEKQIAKNKTADFRGEASITAGTNSGPPQAWSNP